MAILVFAGLLAGFGAILFGLHALRVRGYRGAFTALIAGLWFLTFVLGSAGYRVDTEWMGMHFQLRLSTGVFVLIFSAILLAYICEGVVSTRELISVSIGSLVFVGIIETSLPFLNDLRGAVGVLQVQARPSYIRMTASLLITGFDLFFAVSFFQFLWNQTRGQYLFVLLLCAMAVPMALDSVLFLLATRPQEFSALIGSHLLFKLPLCGLIAIPMTMYVQGFRETGKLDLSRGSLDIFRKIKVLEEDLSAANEELKRYALNLERMVDERTAELRQKQAFLDMELTMAQEVQSSSLPGPGRIPGLNAGAVYLPASSVSGDIYEYGNLSAEESFFFVADISGHGVPAALIGSMCKMLLASMDLASLGPSGVLREIAHCLRPFSGDHYLTAFVAFVKRESREMVYASGAHVPVLVAAGSQIAELPATGSIVAGAVPPDFEQKRVRYPAGARLALYTDGLVEHKNGEHEEFGAARFREALLQTNRMAPEQAADTVVSVVRAFGGGLKFADDVTLLIVDL